MGDTNNNISQIVFQKSMNSLKRDSNFFPTDLKLKPAVVVDIITNQDHPYFQSNIKSNKYGSVKRVDPTGLPLNYLNLEPNIYDIDYSYIGRIKFRFLDSKENESLVLENNLSWAIPLDNSIIQYPLLNEQVLIIQLDNSYYYTKPISKFNFVGTNAQFSDERRNNINYQSATPENANLNKKSYLYSPNTLYGKNGIGYLGEYFIFNPYIRSVKKYEGDTVIESRFGQSIRFTSYNEDRSIDNGSSIYGSYNLNKNIFKLSSDGGYGNPRIVIRNRQRNLAQNVKRDGLHDKLPPLPPIKDSEKNYGGEIEEDINNDGSTIEINSGKYKSKWISSVYKSTFIENREEQTGFSPPGCTAFKIPEPLDGDQIIINTDRLILSSRLKETMHYSKKRYAVVTDDEYTVDANDQIVMTTNNLTCLNSPLIYLGQYGENNEPALLGQTTVDWLYDLCNWLLEHVHWYHHVHPHPHTHEDAGLWDKLHTEDANPNQTQISVQQIKLKLLRDSLHRNLSRRVFLTGGGYAEGRNGEKPKGSKGDCKDPITINMVNGMGGITAFKGRNRREGPLKTIYKYENEPKDLVGFGDKLDKLNKLPNVTSLSQSDKLSESYKNEINNWVNNLTEEEGKAILIDGGLIKEMELKGTLDSFNKRFSTI